MPLPLESKIRITFLIGSLEIGGSETQLVELASRLDRTRYEPSICAMFRSGPLAAVAQNRGVPVTVLGPIIKSGAPRWLGRIKFLTMCLRLVRHLQHTRPHIVCAFLYWAYVPGSIAARLARVPVFISCRRGLGLHKNSRPFLKWLENIADRLTDLVVVNSDAVRRDVLAREQIARSVSSAFTMAWMLSVIASQGIATRCGKHSGSLRTRASSA